MSHRYAFVTEKVLKPILAHKPFVAFGPAHYLGLLRELGFRTYHPFINEAYDGIEDPAARRAALYTEVQRLVGLPRSAWDNAGIAAVADHNAHHLANGLDEVLHAHRQRVMLLVAARSKYHTRGIYRGAP